MHSDALVVTAPMLGGIVSPVHGQPGDAVAAAAAAAASGSTATSGGSEQSGGLVSDGTSAANGTDGSGLESAGNADGQGDEGEESMVETEAERNVQRLQEELATLRRRRSELEAAAGIGEQQQVVHVNRVSQERGAAS